MFVIGTIIQQFTIKAMYSAKESASFINKEGTVEEKVSSRSWPQLHKGSIVSWKLCLNLCSLKWLRPSLSLVISLIPSGLWIWKKELGEVCKYFFLKDWNTLRVSKIGV